MGCPGCDGRSYRHIAACRAKRIAVGLPASSSAKAMLGDDFKEVIKRALATEAERQPKRQAVGGEPASSSTSAAPGGSSSSTSAAIGSHVVQEMQTDDTEMEDSALLIAAVHPYGHELPIEVSRESFADSVGAGRYVEEDTGEVLPNTQVLDGG